MLQARIANTYTPDRSNPLEELNDIRFHERYHMQKETVRNIITIVAPGLARPTRRSNPLPPTLCVCIALELLGSNSFQRIIGRTEGLTKSTVCKTLWSFVDLLFPSYREHISFPRAESANTVKAKFFDIAGILPVRSRCKSIGLTLDLTELAITCYHFHKSTVIFLQTHFPFMS